MEKYTFPLLFKDNRFYKLFIEEDFDEKGYKALIISEYGIIDGKITTTKPQIIRAVSKTESAFQRAKKLAKTKWENKKTIDRFHEEKNKNSGFKPLAPLDYEKHKSKAIFPIYLQPKLDGNRAITEIKPSGETRMLSRQRKEIPHMQHFTELIKKATKNLINKDLIYYLDGELIAPHLSTKDMRSILGTKNKKNNEIKKLEYYLFDIYIPENPEIPYYERLAIIKKIADKSPQIKITRTEKVKNEDELSRKIALFRKQGLEGGILRNIDGFYKSNQVFKIKFYFQDKFKIAGYHEGSGSNEGTVVWELRCKNSNKTFRARPMGTREERMKLFQNASKYIGKELNVQYFKLDKNGCVERIKTSFLKKEHH